MTKGLVVTARQAQALFKAAQRERGIVEIDPKRGVVTLIPEVYAATRTKVDDRSGPPAKAVANEEDGLTIEKGEEMMERPEPFLRPVENKINALTRYFRTKRLEPWNLAEKDRVRHEALAEADWKERLLKSELNNLEMRVLGFLVAKSTERFAVGSVSGAGPVTIERLMFRGFVQVSYRDNYPYRVDMIWATPGGVAGYKTHNAPKGYL